MPIEEEILQRQAECEADSLAIVSAQAWINNCRKLALRAYKDARANSVDSHHSSASPARVDQPAQAETEKEETRKNYHRSA